jgi:hypothetical protein
MATDFLEFLSGSGLGGKMVGGRAAQGCDSGAFTKRDRKRYDARMDNDGGPCLLYDYIALL